MDFLSFLSNFKLLFLLCFHIYSNSSVKAQKVFLMEVMGAVSKTAKKAKRSASDILDNFQSKCKSISLDLNQNKIDISEHDSLGDKTFFAFLADLLRGFLEAKKQTDIMKELEKNENLTREKIMSFLNEELETNEKLTKEQKDRVGIFMNSKGGSDFCVELVGKKFKEINDFRMDAKKLGMESVDIAKKVQKIDFMPKDIQEMTATDKKMFADSVVSVVKNIAKKVITKQ